MYNRIITHNDMDGVVSAAICAAVFHIDDIHFASPNTISRNEITMTQSDIVCDLPYPISCGLWFDHHEGNLLDLHYRNIDIAQIAGRFAPLPSCSRVVYGYFREQGIVLPAHLEDTVSETDIIDSFNYKSVGEWRAETPGKLIDYFLKAPEPQLRERHRSLRRLVRLIRDLPLTEVAFLPEIAEGVKRYKVHEERMLKLIAESAYLYPDEQKGEVVVIDLSKHNRRPAINKNLAFLLYPRALAVLEFYPIFDQGVKTTNLGVALSLSFIMNSLRHEKDVGEIMRVLNIGDGHRGAAGGKIYASSKAEMLRKKSEIIEGIYRLWKQQSVLTDKTETAVETASPS